MLECVNNMFIKSKMCNWKTSIRYIQEIKIQLHGSQVKQQLWKTPVHAHTTRVQQLLYGHHLAAHLCHANCVATVKLCLIFICARIRSPGET